MSEQLAERRGAVLARLGSIDSKRGRAAGTTETAAKQVVDHERRLMDLERQRDATSRDHRRQAVQRCPGQDTVSPGRFLPPEARGAKVLVPWYHLH